MNKTIEEEKELLRHAVGTNRNPKPYRNHFVTGTDSTDWPICDRARQKGWMKDHGPQSNSGGMHLFTVTPSGLAAINCGPIQD